MQVTVIRSADDLEAAEREIETLWNAELGSEEGDKLEALVALVAAYEDKHYPVPKADPVEMLRFSMEQNGRSQADLAELLGSRSRASEILSRKRDLTLGQIRKIGHAWRIPVALLVGDLETA